MLLVVYNNQLPFYLFSPLTYRSSYVMISIGLPALLICYTILFHQYILIEVKVDLLHSLFLFYYLYVYWLAVS